MFIRSSHCIRACVAARDAAKAHLEKTGAGASKYETDVEKHGKVLAEKIRDAAAAAGDNTLEQLRMRSTEKRQAEANIAEQQRVALAAINAAKKRKAEEAAAAAGELAPDWQAVTDANGQTYYWNTVTQVTTWLRPVASAAVPPPPPPPLPLQTAAAAAAASLQQAALAAAVSSSSSTGGSSGAHQQGAQSAVPVGAELALPAGWKEVRHAATGQLFWVHEDTKERRRVRPTESDAAVSTSSSSSSSNAASSQPAAKRAKPSAGPVGPQLPGRR
jgi:WW domain